MLTTLLKHSINSQEYVAPSQEMFCPAGTTHEIYNVPFYTKVTKNRVIQVGTAQCRYCPLFIDGYIDPKSDEHKVIIYTLCNGVKK
jgi:hypothetical protein